MSEIIEKLSVLIEWAHDRNDEEAVNILTNMLEWCRNGYQPENKYSLKNIRIVIDQLEKGWVRR